jgi:DNA-binding MarR family transcriptional regulator
MAARQTGKPPPRRGTAVRDSDIGYLLKQLNSAFRRRLDERLRDRELDLSMAHMAALFTLQDEPGLAGAQLARRTMISAQAMNGVLRRLEKDSLISRQQHPENRHTDSWTLTTAGSRRLLQARRVTRPLLQKMLAALSAAEQREFRRLLARCIESLEAPAS